MRITRSDRRRRAHTFVAVAALLLAPIVASAADCVVQCAGAPSCKLTVAGDLVKPPLPANHRLHLALCEKAKLIGADAGAGAVVFGVYQGPKGLVNFTVAVDQDREFGALVPALASAACALGSSCLEDRETRRVSQLGGMGADEVKTIHAGQPCALGLPCGPILKPAVPLVVALAGVRSGSVTLTAVRGADRKPVDLPVVDGRVVIPAAALTAGGVYQYRLQSPQVATATAGEFSVIASRMQADVEDAIRDLARERPDSAAVGEIETLLNEGLRWDATQRSR